jgi:hypothetical protein
VQVFVCIAGYRLKIRLRRTLQVFELIEDVDKVVKVWCAVWFSVAAHHTGDDGTMHQSAGMPALSPACLMAPSVAPGAAGLPMLSRRAC